ncbi:hypothetical protein [Helicobacter fennelliae]|uniref:Uncharacterized protein n=2 Tax=Helicobacter fennelliae TaxID=215 RepID=T1DWJ1_9HELI|nr:hypothetical protein [Helicobacter fennelliae]GAD19683.1 hypothetical protein HFN_0923 [Helicobacter fennelliae MRY12-0050]SQB99602.1 Uncharacterised protein [Helicobacter fennelliae]STP07274.1 Uncharacterised protein [Helicobacter fennelliae]STQ85142.1 Uncharacterised protein [Helicobacter fennelliae]
MRQIYGDLKIFQNFKLIQIISIRPKDSTYYILACFGTLLYLSALNLLPFDLYHLRPFMQGAIVALVVFVVYECAIFGFLAQNLSFYEFIICPYLWLYSVGKSIYQILKSAYNGVWLMMKS